MNAIELAKTSLFRIIGYLPLPYQVLGYTLVGCLISVIYQKRAGLKISVWRAFGFCFPKRTWLSQSAKTDYKLNLFLCLVFGPLAGGIVLVNSAKVTEKVLSALQHLPVLGSMRFAPRSGFWVEFLYTTAFVVILDLCKTLQHIALHRIPWLWEFHKAHHSAETLNILTTTRTHPIELLTRRVTQAICVAVVAGFAYFFLGYRPSIVTLFGVPWILGILYMHALLRHSHIWISFGRPMSYIFTSPAMHQIHHSMNPKHHDKNYGENFAFWDLLLGTLYVPKQRERIKFGLDASARGAKRYDTLFGILVHPFLPNSLLQKWRTGSDSRVPNARKSTQSKAA